MPITPSFTNGGSTHAGFLDQTFEEKLVTVFHELYHISPAFDGDLRRLIERGADLRGLHAEDVMHRQPRSLSADALAVDAAEVMEQHRVTSVLAVDGQGRLVGALNTNDLMRAKVI